MWDWAKARWELVRTTIANGDVQAFERRYIPTALAAGIVIGACVSLLSQLFALIVILAGGFALGYAARAYVSYRRRMDYLRRRGEDF